MPSRFSPGFDTSKIGHDGNLRIRTCGKALKHTKTNVNSVDHYPAPNSPKAHNLLLVPYTNNLFPHSSPPVYRTRERKWTTYEVVSVNRLHTPDSSSYAWNRICDDKKNLDVGFTAHGHGCLIYAHSYFNDPPKSPKKAHLYPNFM
jgi:hypothetical protein